MAYWEVPPWGLISACVNYLVVDFYWYFERAGRYGRSMVDKVQVASPFWIDEFIRFLDIYDIVGPLLPRGVH